MNKENAAADVYIIIIEGDFVELCGWKSDLLQVSNTKVGHEK